jgi:glycosyltransferase involved in cell wall biosynthesis
VDVICPVYNHELFIEECLKSILEQKEVYVMIHVVDDASTDSTVNIVKKFEKIYPENIRLYQNSKNQGDAVKSLNSSSIQLQGDFWTYIEGDDYLINPYKFRSQVKRLCEKSNLIGTTTQCVVRKTGSSNFEILRPEFSEYSFKDLVIYAGSKKLYTHISAIMWKAETRDSSGKVFPFEFLNGETNSGEVFLQHLLLKKSKKLIEFQDIPGSCYRYHNRGIWSSLDEFEQRKLNEQLCSDIRAITPIWLRIFIVFLNIVPPLNRLCRW